MLIKNRINFLIIIPLVLLACASINFFNSGFPFLKEANIRKRYLEYVHLLENDNFAAAYDYLRAEDKKEKSFEEFSRDMQPAVDIVESQKVEIEAIHTRKKDGYVFPKNTVCFKNGNCHTIKGYRWWVYENGGWYLSLNYPTINREQKPIPNLNYEEELYKLLETSIRDKIDFTSLVFDQEIIYFY